jgi:hypothetical protein
MAFGQQSGPPASHGQLKELLTLLNQAGHTDFRDARGSLGFTQRQAGGKFSRDEAQAFIDQLQEAEDAGVAVERPAARVALSAVERNLRGLPAEALAAELQRRGWIVIEPT